MVSVAAGKEDFMRAGQEIRWVSQSQGSEIEKKGTIIADIPDGESAMKHVPNAAKKSHIKFGDISTKDRVLVAVPVGKGGQITHYYCPLKIVLNAQGV